MIDIALNGLSKFFGEAKILENLTFDIQQGEHVALIGKNGSGKTTLFRILSGREGYDSGTLTIPKGKKLSVLDQLPSYPAGHTVGDVMRLAFAQADAVAKEMERLEKRMSIGIDDRQTLKDYDALLLRYQLMGGYERDTALLRTALGLGIPREMWDQPYDELSGGEKTRVNLARILLEQTDILLLDEPTNHLDMHAVEWLENYLQDYCGTVVVVSHDRYFLDRVTTKTVELEFCHATVYDGPYSFYAQRKEEIVAEQERLREKTQKEIDRLSYTSTRMHGWGLGNKKMMRKAFALDKRIERLKANQPEATKKERQMRGKLIHADRSGFDVLFVDRMTKVFGQRTLFSDLNLEIRKDEAIAILGENGCGKTTLLRILLGQEQPTSGHYLWGASLKIAYLPQQVCFENENATVLETVVSALKLTEPAARNRLGAYLFRGDEVFKTVSVLSGGEKSRLKLCILLYEEINLLILDEPTNHLDIASREWIESILETFEGTLLFVSHDRYFTDRFATRLWLMENGTVRDFAGTYAQYQRAQELARIREVAEKRTAEKTAPKPAPKAGVDRALSPEKQKRKLERAIAQVEKEIAQFEAEKSEIENQLPLYATDHVRLQELCKKQEDLDAKLAQCYATWESLGEQL